MNIFEEVIHRLSSKTRTRSLFNDTHIEDMEKIIHRMQLILEEKKQEKATIEEKRKAKNSMIKNIENTLKEHGLSINDLNKTPSSKKTKPTPKAKKTYTFQYKTISDDTVLWYGPAVGRLPKAFQNYLERTHQKRMDCLISESNE